MARKLSHEGQHGERQGSRACSGRAVQCVRGRCSRAGARRRGRRAGREQPMRRSRLERRRWRSVATLARSCAAHHGCGVHRDTDLYDSGDDHVIMIAVPCGTVQIAVCASAAGFAHFSAPRPPAVTGRHADKVYEVSRPMAYASTDRLLRPDVCIAPRGSDESLGLAMIGLIIAYEAVVALASSRTSRRAITPKQTPCASPIRETLSVLWASPLLLQPSCCHRGSSWRRRDDLARFR